MTRCVLCSLQAGNQTATIMSLCCLKDHNLTTVINLTAIRDSGGLEVLVNLLETDDFKCKVKYAVTAGLLLSIRQFFSSIYQLLKRKIPSCTKILHTHLCTCRREICSVSRYDALRVHYQ